MSRLRVIWATLKAAPGILLEAVMQTQRDDNPGGDGTVTETTELPINSIHRHIVIPKHIINSMPIWWQADFRRLMTGLRLNTGYNVHNHEFQIIKRDIKGRFEVFTEDMDIKVDPDRSEELF